MTNISQIIVKNLTKCYIFYLPRTIQPTVEGSYLKNIIPDEGYDSILFYDNQGKSMTSGIEDIILINILGKERILKMNLVTLLEAQSSISKAAFNIILEDYQNQIELHKNATSWMYENIKVVFPNIEDVFISAFKIQANHFNVHCSQIHEHFRFIKQEDKVLKHLKSTSFSSEVKSVKLDQLQFQKPQNPTSTSISTSTPISIPKKKRVITDEEIDAFLLESVFSVKL
ncbi:hypothetical protein [Psychroserpens damuponensis]|uniref:hypothetical protein n=1 Tax=Psychroserpens damuponensis TaxID=943936 RepID=UPI00058D503E|nr:hypothetical protein [Psychroserpens damuponensis]